MCRPPLKLLVVVGLLAVPRMVAAQSAIAGVVRDTTGAVLPGVTVEVTSPALIEKVRTATTDQAGQYRVVDLRPGSYSVVFTLAGFNSIRREGIVLEANFTAPVVSRTTPAIALCAATILGTARSPTTTSSSFSGGLHIRPPLNRNPS